MSASKKIIQAAAGNVAGGFYPYTVDNSVRLNSGNSDYLTFTPSTNGNNTTFTLRFMVKRSGLGAQQWLFLTNNSYNSSYTGVRFNSNDTLEYFNIVGGSVPAQMITSSVFRDTSAWYDIVISVSSTNVDIYVNGVEQPYGTTNQPSGETTGVNRSGNLMSTSNVSGISNGAQHGYLAEMVLIDGSALTPTSFGEFKNGVWVPKDCSGLTFGTNGAYLKFGNSASLGTDSSGNSNNWTVNGLTSSDQMIDTPTNNFATLNPIASDSSATYSEGNLSVNQGVNEKWRSYLSTISFDIADDYYVEFVAGSLTNAGMLVGIVEEVFDGLDIDPTYLGNRFWSGVQSGTTGYGYYGQTGDVYSADSSVATESTYTTGDVIGVHVSSGSLTFYKNNVSQGVVASGLSGRWKFAVGLYFSGNDASVKFGQSGFTYTPPTGALALCTANLPEPTISPNTNENSTGTTSSEHFNTVLWTGTGATNNITGVGFQPDWVWIKNRSAAQNHVLHDAVRGAGKYIMSDSTNAEATNTNQLSSFDSDGFTVGTAISTNQSGSSFVGWNWKGNGSGSSNTDGTITSTVSANTDAGISIVTFTAPASGGFTVGHGLGATPAFVTVKIRDTAGYNWYTWHQSFASTTTSYTGLDGTNAVSTGVYTMWPSGVSSTTASFNVGYSTIANSDNVAYIFAEVEGFSKFGSYTGNGSSDGPFIYTGFRPAWVMTKRTDSTSSWYIWDVERDTYNAVGSYLVANLSQAEQSLAAGYFDFCSNGFKLRNTSTEINASGGTYIYMAFAEMPFKYSVGR